MPEEKGSGKDAQLPRTSDRLGPIGRIKLSINVRRVGFDGAPSDDEMLGDLLVGFTQGHKLENFELALAQRLDQIVC